MNKKTELVICLGSSCFARGNKNTTNVIKSFIKEKNMQDKVLFHGGHCFGNCADGPILKINDTIYTGVDDIKALEILREAFER
jgi:NADH:ubiquinone oxidoreductase subunit E